MSIDRQFASECGMQTIVLYSDNLRVDHHETIHRPIQNPPQHAESQPPCGFYRYWHDIWSSVSLSAALCTTVCCLHLFHTMRQRYYPVTCNHSGLPSVHIR
eukprot:17607_1